MPRKEDSVVQEEQQRLEETKRQELEDRRLTEENAAVQESVQ